MRLPFIGEKAHVAPVTLVVAVLDDACLLPALLSGIERQVVAPAEILVADRGSTDGTPQLLNEWSPPPLLSLKVIEASGTTAAEARNLAIETASHESVVVTEPAAQPDPYWISRLWAALYSGAAVASGRVRATGSNVMERVIASVRMPELQDPRRPPASSVNLAFVKSAWDEVGGYPEWLEAGQDEVFVAALRGAGAHIVDVPDAIVSWNPGQRIGEFAAGSFRNAQAWGQAGLLRSPGLSGLAAAGALLACACIRRSLWSVAAGAIVMRSEKVLGSVWQSRADAVDPLGTRMGLTIGVRLLGDVTAVAGYVVGRFAALRGIDPVKVRSDRRERIARFRSGAVSLVAAVVDLSVHLLLRSSDTGGCRA
ncbi:glycosyltransferase [Nakamurella sp. GG22]